MTTKTPIVLVLAAVFVLGAGEPPQDGGFGTTQASAKDLFQSLKKTVKKVVKQPTSKKTTSKSSKMSSRTKKTLTEGALITGVATVGCLALAGDNKGACAAVAVGGAAVTVGVAAAQDAQAKKAESLQGQIAQQRNQNAELAKATADAEELVAMNNERIRILRADLAEGRITEAEYQTEVASMEQDRDLVRRLMADATSRRDDLASAAVAARSSGKTGSAESLAKEASEMDDLIGRLQHSLDDMEATPSS